MVPARLSKGGGGGVEQENNTRGGGRAEKRELDPHHRVGSFGQRSPGDVRLRDIDAAAPGRPLFRHSHNDHARPKSNAPEARTALMTAEGAAEERICHDELIS